MDPKVAETAIRLILSKTKQHPALIHQKERNRSIVTAVIWP